MVYGKAEGRAAVAVVDLGIGVLTGEAWTEPGQRTVEGGGRGLETDMVN